MKLRLIMFWRRWQPDTLVNIHRRWQQNKHWENCWGFQESCSGAKSESKQHLKTRKFPANWFEQVLTLLPISIMVPQHRLAIELIHCRIPIENKKVKKTTFKKKLNFKNCSCKILFLLFAWSILLFRCRILLDNQANYDVMLLAKVVIRDDKWYR